MKEYPSIPAAGHLLAQSAEAYLGRPFVAFEKLDGSNVRAEWDRSRGWHQFGSRRRLLDATQPLLGRAVQLILDGYGDGLAKVFTDDPALGRPQLDPDLTALWKEFGPPRQSDHPEYLFWRLQNDGVWAVQTCGPVKARLSNSDPPKGELLAQQATGGFTPQAQAALKADPSLASCEKQSTARFLPGSFNQYTRHR
jgi:hypothetical protein